MEYIKDFQIKNCLKPDNIMGKNTARKMADVCDLSNEQAAHFLGQVHHETAGFTYDEENLNYSALGLLKTFPKYFDIKNAKKYAYKTKDIANVIYGGRMGNLKSLSNDGYKYRGRGCIQLTGKNNYRKFSQDHKIDVLEFPDRILPEYYWETGLWYFDVNSLWQKCNEITYKSIQEVTSSINGGYNGLADRKKLTLHYIKLLTNGNL